MKALLTILSVSAVLSTFALADSGNIGTQPNNPPMQNNQDQGMQSNNGYQFHGVRTNEDNRQDGGKGQSMRRDGEHRQDMREERRQDRREDRQEVRENRGGGQGGGGMRKARH